mmetsp:Transcript_18964/g.26766  ORF Transcript_18964/g.26766 Transcript_18964/m.26766 type:complete len:945 (-) Transcript_18964:1343-4177(-)
MISSYDSDRRRGISLIYCFVLVLILLATAKGDDINGKDKPHENGVTKTNNNKKQTDKNNDLVPNNGDVPKKLMNLGESIRRSQLKFRQERAETMQKYWKRTFKEIKNSTSTFPSTAKSVSESPGRGGPSSMFTQWKAYIEEQRSGSTNAGGSKPLKQKKRFDGFASWDRILQEWADDVGDYIEKAQAETGGEYSFSNYGKSTTMEESDTRKEPSRASSKTLKDSATSYINATTAIDGVSSQSKVPSLPIPAPAKPGESIVPHTDLSDKSKNILIVTTASLPWMTGTAVNPMLRAAYMTIGRAKAGGSVTLMLPWLERESDQERVYGKNKFESEQQQEEWLRDWLCNTAGMEKPSKELKIRWYPAWVQTTENSVYSMGDIMALIPEDEVDICILEEPEHLNWYRAPGEGWTNKFKHVVGIVHTNYFVYAQEQPAALIRAPAMRLLCSWMCRAHCHRVIKLSGTLGKFAPEKELVENVHGVRGTFLECGEKLRKKLSTRAGATDPVFGPDADPTVYFIGKMLWSKGLGSLMELLKYAEESADLKIKVDMYGGGPDKDAASAKAEKLGLEMPFLGPIDHAELGETHKVFINPSTSEVLCTTVAEALAMGKFVIVPSHPSNDFFAQFPNCLTYTSKEEFVGNLYYTLTHSPEPLIKEYAFALSWAAATERLEAAGCISVEEAKAREEALAHPQAGVEIGLPPVVEDEEARNRIVSTFSQSRETYRQFRSRLSQEVQQSNVLPKELQKRMVAELDKRLDVDIETLLDSPKLRLQLSPAELDSRLLKFYKDITKGQLGDVLRIIGGGTEVGRQTLYIKKQASKQRNREMKLANSTVSSIDWLPPGLDDILDDTSDPTESIATQMVKRALKRNLPVRKASSLNAAHNDANEQQNGLRVQSKNKRDTTKMSLSILGRGDACQQPIIGVPVQHITKTGFIPRSMRRQSYIPLI